METAVQLQLPSVTKRRVEMRGRSLAEVLRLRMLLLRLRLRLLLLSLLLPLLLLLQLVQLVMQLQLLLLRDQACQGYRPCHCSHAC